jgi:hypothetical protein
MNTRYCRPCGDPVAEQEGRQEEDRAEAEAEEPKWIAPQCWRRGQGNAGRDRDRQVDQAARAMEELEQRIVLLKPDGVQAEVAGDAGHRGNHQGPAFPRRDANAVGAGGDKAQQADVLLLVMPELPGEEAGQQPAAQVRRRKLKGRGAACDQPCRHDQVSRLVCPEVAVERSVRIEPGAGGDVEIGTNERDGADEPKTEVGVFHAVLGEGQHEEGQDAGEGDQSHEDVPGPCVLSAADLSGEAFVGDNGHSSVLRDYRYRASYQPVGAGEPDRYK